MTDSNNPDLDYRVLADDIKSWGAELGFQGVGISNIELQAAEQRLKAWLDKHFHGQMDYMARHGLRRSRPDQLVPGTVRVLCARMNYWPNEPLPPTRILGQPDRGYVSRYALGRDYHKVLRKRLQKLAGRIRERVGEFGYRVFSDSAPVLEKALAEKAGLGWIGKHTNLIHRSCGSWFFLGEIYTDLPLPVDPPVTGHCGSCSACIDACPTGAIVGPYQLDARLCISYLTIELRGSIPPSLRPMVGNRIFGCDDCQLVCPWNRFAQASDEPDFSPRRAVHDRDLVALFAWSETDFLRHTEGSAIRRIGYECWLRNLAVALGNAPYDAAIEAALRTRDSHPSTLVREHVSWALGQQRDKRPSPECARSSR